MVTLPRHFLKWSFRAEEIAQQLIVLGTLPETQVQLFLMATWQLTTAARVPSPQGCDVLAWPLQNETLT